MDLKFFDQKIDRKSEIELLLNNFRNRITYFEPYTTYILKSRIQDFNRREELLFYAPYWLTEICNTEFPISKTRRTVLANLLGVVHITIQDKQIDNQKIMGDDFAILSLKSNLLFLETIDGLNEVYHEYPLFRYYLRKYFDEFTNATIHEKENHWRKFQDFGENEMHYLGKKFAPVKIACAGTLILGNNVEEIISVENLIDDYYTGYQLIDDIEDWKEDFELGNFTYFLNQLNRRRQLIDIINVDEDILKNTIYEVVEDAKLYFQRALDQSKKLQLLQLFNHIKRKIEQIDSIYRNEKALTTNSNYLIHPNVIQFERRRKFYIYNTHNNAFARIDKTAKRLLTLINCDLSLDSILANQKTNQKAEYENIALSLAKHNFIVKNDQIGVKAKTRVFHVNGIHPIMRLEIVLSQFNIQRIYDYLELFFHSCTNSYNREIILINKGKSEINIIDVVNKIGSVAEVLHQNLKMHLLIGEQILNENFEVFISCENIYSIALFADTFWRESKKKPNLPEKVKFILNKDVNSKHIRYKDWIFPCSQNLQEIQYFQQEFKRQEYLNSMNKSEMEQRLNNRAINCNAGISSLCITEAGEITPCFWHNEKERQKDQFSFDAIKKMQMKHLNRTLGTKCQECKIVNLCAGGCQYEETENQFCKIQRKEFEEVIVERNAD